MSLYKIERESELKGQKPILALFVSFALLLFCHNKRKNSHKETALIYE